MVKELEKLNIKTKLLTPFEEDCKSFSEVDMVQLQNFGEKLHLSNFMYGTVRKIVYSKKFSSFIPYEKILEAISKKLANSIEKTLTEKPSIIQAEQEVAGLAVISVAKKFGSKAIVDLHNIWPEELVDSGYIKRDNKTFRNLMNIEKKIVEKADGIIAVNEYMKEYLLTKFDVDNNKIIVVPPAGEVLSNNSDVMKKKSEEKKIVYSGLVTSREHVDLFVKSIPYVKSKFPKTNFIISEKGEAVNEIKHLCKSLSINPKFYWYKSRIKARDLLHKCYLGILPSSNDIGRKLGTPLKLLEYMSMGLPVVANDIGSWCDIIQKEKIGILTKDDPKDFAKGICTLIEDPEMYYEMQKRTLRVIKEKFNWQIHVAKKLLPFYQKMLN